MAREEGYWWVSFWDDQIHREFCPLEWNRPDESFEVRGIEDHYGWWTHPACHGLINRKGEKIGAFIGKAPK